MALLLEMVSRNLPLHKWKELASRAAQETAFKGYCSGGKNVDNVVATIVNALSNDVVADLVADEWEGLPSYVRAPLTIALNDAMGTRSNNKTKGIARLDRLLNGRVLRTTHATSSLTDASGRKVNAAKAGAERTHAAHGVPPNYDSLSPSEKRRLREKLAADRRYTKGN